MRFERTIRAVVLGLCATCSAIAAAAPDDTAALAVTPPAPLWFNLADALTLPPAASGSEHPTAPDTRSADTASADAASTGSRLRQLLADFSMTLRNIRYRRGGREPSTGFDCSGFVRYVFHHSLGADLPSDSASQYMAGAKVTRADMRTGDLVFFRTRGRHVSHVGIYLDNGRFIHSPSSGKSVSINRLDDAYWAKRFVGAKRPNVLS